MSSKTSPLTQAPPVEETSAKKGCSRLILPFCATVICACGLAIAYYLFPPFHDFALKCWQWIHANPQNFSILGGLALFNLTLLGAIISLS